MGIFRYWIRLSFTYQAVPPFVRFPGNRKAQFRYLNMLPFRVFIRNGRTRSYGDDFRNRLPTDQKHDDRGNQEERLRHLFRGPVHRNLSILFGIKNGVVMGFPKNGPPDKPFWVVSGGRCFLKAFE